MPKSKKEEKIRDYRAHLFVVLGFIGAALTTEVMTILHETAKSLEGGLYWVYAIFIVFIAWPFFVYKTVKLLDEIYLGKK